MNVIYEINQLLSDFESEITQEEQIQVVRGAVNAYLDVALSHEGVSPMDFGDQMLHRMKQVELPKKAKKAIDLNSAAVLEEYLTRFKKDIRIEYDGESKTADPSKAWTDFIADIRAKNG